MSRRAALTLAALVLAAMVSGAASAHIQVLPATAAPGDSTLFTLLVPNEADNPTVQVELKIPEGVIPFSFEETPGWERSETLKPDQSIDVVSWTGSLPAGEFARFSFLASTPEREGTITWPAVQTYEDGTKVRWIGGPDSEEPASVTVVSAGAAAQNAGGESAAAGAAEAEGSPTSPIAGEGDEDDDGSTSVLPIVALALGALGLAAGALALVRSRRAG